MNTYMPTMPPGSAEAGPSSGATAPEGRGRLFAIIFGAVAVVVTLGAIALAAIAPVFSSTPPNPGNWTKGFDADFSSQASAVSTGQGCEISSSGLHVVGTENHHVACDVAAVSPDSLANGFLLTVTLAPASQIVGAQQPYIALGDTGVVAVAAGGGASTIVICTSSCGSDNSNEVDAQSDAWHGEAFYANTLTLYWPGSGQQLTVYANGQQVGAVDFSYSAGTSGLALGAVAQGEALYTHLTVYTP